MLLRNAEDYIGGLSAMVDSGFPCCLRVPLSVAVVVLHCLEAQQ